LALAMCLALSTCTRDFHPLDCAHAGRTNKAPHPKRVKGLIRNSPLSGGAINIKINYHGIITCYYLPERRGVF